MEYDNARLAFSEDLDEEFSIEEMNKYLDEYLSDEDWDEDLLTDDLGEIDRKVAYFDARIAELEAELERLNRQSKFSLSDSSGGLSGQRDRIEYRIEIFEDQRDILLGHKEVLEGKPLISNEEVFAKLERKLEVMKLERTK